MVQAPARTPFAGALPPCYLSFMKLRAFGPAALVLLFAGCQSEDPRLPEQIYQEALKLNVNGKGAEAKIMLEQLARRFPDSKYALQARKDLVSIEFNIKRDLNDRQRVLRVSIKRVMDALTRYKGKRSEYPERLADLVPEYLDQVPETPWGHPYLYRPYVLLPIEDIPGRHGTVTQRFNTKLDGYYLACLGTDGEPGGEDMAADLLVKDGEVLPSDERTFPPLPTPQPVR